MPKCLPDRAQIGSERGRSAVRQRRVTMLFFGAGEAPEGGADVGIGG
jgi:hypothetical protein